MQSKLESFKETLTNILIGYVTAIFSQLVIFPFFDIKLPIDDNIQIAVWFTLISFVRSYVIRRWFNKKHPPNQTRLQSFIETATNIAIGFTVAIASQVMIFPLYGIHVAFTTNLHMGVWFTVIAIGRMYIIRRWYNYRLHSQQKVA